MGTRGTTISTPDNTSGRYRLSSFGALLLMYGSTTTMSALYWTFGVARAYVSGQAIAGIPSYQTNNPVFLCNIFDFQYLYRATHRPVLSGKCYPERIQITIGMGNPPLCYPFIRNASYPAVPALLDPSSPLPRITCMPGICRYQRMNFK